MPMLPSPEARAVWHLRCMIRKLAEAERTALVVSEENANLALELNMRPSIKQVHSLQRQVQAQQRQLARAKARCQEHDIAMPTPEDPPLGESRQNHAPPTTV